MFLSPGASLLKMPFRLQRSESLVAGVQRILQEQLTAARCSLVGGQQSQDEAIHDARKRLKKSRALLRLVRSGMGSEFSEWNHALRDLGHLVSGARDAATMQATLDGLKTHDRSGGLQTEYAEQRLAKYRGANQHVPEHISQKLEELASGLQERMQATREIRLKGSASRIVMAGFRKTYKQGRQALRAALKTPTDENWHEWRKRAKDHWYQLRLLRNVWKPVLQARITACDDLCGRLGDDHDLAVFQRFLSQRADAATVNESLTPLLEFVDQERILLKAQCRAEGARLFAESPDAIGKRFHVYWKLWRRKRSLDLPD